MRNGLANHSEDAGLSDGLILRTEHPPVNELTAGVVIGACKAVTTAPESNNNLRFAEVGPQLASKHQPSATTLRTDISTLITLYTDARHMPL